jgi:glycosyltransferase involved in cell wall biosynthesis
LSTTREFKSLISAVIITLNEAARIESCINSLLDLVDEIVVVDSFSTDETKAICESKNVAFYQREWMGYSQTKNLANKLATHDTILSVDADEQPDATLSKEILNLRLTDFKGAYQIRRKNFYGEKWVHYCGWYPDSKIRIFNRQMSKWDGDYVHEKLITNEPIIDLKGHLLHFTIEDTEDHLTRINKYAELAALNSLKQNKSISLLNAILSTSLTFLKIFVFKLGFLDGLVGWHVSINSSKSKWLRYRYFKELAHKSNDVKKAS